jgi:integrase
MIMPKIKLTTRTIEKLRAPDPSGQQQLYWDDALRGFGVCVSGTTNSRNFIVQRDIDGRSRRVTVGACNVLSLEQARRRAEGILADFYKGIDPKTPTSSRLTLRAALANYLTNNRRLRPKSREDYQRNITLYLTAWLDKPLAAITPAMVVEKHAKIAAAVAAKGRYSGESTANGVMRTLRSIWFHAAESDPSLPPNPVGRTMRRAWYPVPRRERHVPAAQLPQFYAALRQLPNPIHADYLELLLLTGLRKNEAASLEWQNVDLQAKVIRIPAVRTKSGKKLDLPMNDLVYDLLSRRAALGRERYVFPSRSGHLTEPKISLQLVAKACGIAVSCHDLRRSFASIAEASDISYLSLKALLNHSVGNGDVTGNYVQLNTERLREAAQRVGARMKALLNGDNT